MFEVSARPRCSHTVRYCWPSLAGLLAGPAGPLFATVIQEHSPEEIRGRVFGASYALIQAGGPIGLVVGGFLVEGVGLVPAVVGMGVVYLTVALSTILNPALGTLDPEKHR